MSFSTFEDNHRNYVKNKTNNDNDEEYPLNNYTVFAINEKKFKHTVKIYQYDYFDLAERQTMVTFEKDFRKLQKMYLTKQKSYTEGMHLKRGKTLKKYQGDHKNAVYCEYSSLQQLVDPLYAEIKRIKAIKKMSKD